MASTRLHSCEIAVCAAVWIGSIGYSLYQLHLFGNCNCIIIFLVVLICNASDADPAPVVCSCVHIDLGWVATENEGFSEGWALTGRKKDVTDATWATWKNFFAESTPWLCVHFAGAEIVRYTRIEFLRYWYLLVSLAFTTTFVGVLPSVLLLVLPCIYFGLLQLRSRKVLWVVSGAIHAAASFERVQGVLSVPVPQQYLVYVAFTWTHLRCLSFCLDVLSSPTHSEQRHVSFTAFLSYACFLPLLYTGPVVTYSSYKDGLLVPFKRWTLKRAVQLVIAFFPYLFWICFIEFALHYIYVSALQHQTRMVVRMGRWQLFGLGYAMAQYFHVKHVVCFGLSAAVARAHEVPSPAQPKCIARMHRATEVWKHFDRGLYLFLVKHVYIPCLVKQQNVVRKLLASLACFCFVGLWHRARPSVLVWCALNFVGFVIEKGVAVLLETRHYKPIEAQLGPRNVRRVHSLGGAFAYLLACASHFYFFGGIAVGNAFVQQLTQDVSMNLYAVFFFYLLSQLSIEIERWEERGRSVKKDDA